MNNALRSTTTYSPAIDKQAKKRSVSCRTLTVTNAIPAQTSEFALHGIDLTQIWSNEVTGTIEYDDLLAMAAAVHIYIKLHFTLQQRYPRS